MIILSITLLLILKEVFSKNIPPPKLWGSRRIVYRGLSLTLNFLDSVMTFWVRTCPFVVLSKNIRCKIQYKSAPRCLFPHYMCCSYDIFFIAAGPLDPFRLQICPNHALTYPLMVFQRLTTTLLNVVGRKVKLSHRDSSILLYIEPQKPSPFWSVPFNTSPPHFILWDEYMIFIYPPHLGVVALFEGASWCDRISITLSLWDILLLPSPPRVSGDCSCYCEKCYNIGKHGWASSSC